MSLLHVFVDEYGDAHLDTSKQGVSSVYILCAVCVWDSALASVSQMAERYRAKGFQSGEMKSSSIGSNDGRRIYFLNALSSLDCFVISLCAEKDKATPDSGLAFKKSFMKFFAQKMFDRIGRYSEQLRIIADSHGSSEYQREFHKYLERRVPRDLFNGAKFDFADSKEEVLLQVADIYAGSLARIYDSKKKSKRDAEIRHALKDKVSLTLWPGGGEEMVQGNPTASEYDEQIRRYCVRVAERYCIDTQNEALNDKEHLARVVFLEALLSSHAWNGRDEYLSTGVLRREIGRQLGEVISEHKFRSSIVAKLRDDDIVIASCAKGYKIPSSYADMRDFALFSNTILPPMVHRIERARKNIREATLGAVDILGAPSLLELRKLADTMSQ